MPIIPKKNAFRSHDATEKDPIALAKGKHFIRAMRVLDALKAQYKIVLPDGSVYGKLEEKPAKPAKPARPNKHMRKYAFGETAVYYKPFLLNLKPDDVALIPHDRFKGTILAANVSSYANTLFGAGNYTVHNDKKAKCVELWRFK